MKKRISAIILISLLVIGSAAYAENNNVLNFQKAVKLMNENNAALQIAKLNRTIAQIDYDKAQAANLMNPSRQSELQAEYNLARAENNYKNAIHNSYHDLLRTYTSVLAAERTLKVRELELVIAENDYAVLQEKIRIGDAGRLDDLEGMNRIEAAKRNFATARHNLLEQETALRRLLGVEKNEVLKLAFDFTLPEIELSLEECIEIGLENSVALWDQENNLKLQERQLETSKIEGMAPIDLKREELSLEIARLNLEQERSNTIESISSAYQSLLDSKSRYESTKREWEIAQETYDIYRKQKEKGLITEIQLLQHKISYLNSEGSLEDALVTYLTNYLQFLHSLGLEGSL